MLDEEQLKAHKMNALLAVGQGSARPPRVVVLQWHGAKSKRAKPLCFVGKGVTFDTGGLSMKPAAGMEDMKGDMGGAACVAGLMLALAGRKAAVNAVGVIGLAENMPSGTAQRPGDIVTSMSGQTIEVLNTDAEGRLVLADALWYAQERFKPRFVIDLATLTGRHHRRAGQGVCGAVLQRRTSWRRSSSAAGEATGEKVWRMPLAKAYDKLIDSKNADMKNIGGRHGGAITAAQFLQRFIKDTPLGAHRHRRHGHGFPPQRDQPELGGRLGRAPARPPGGRQLREGREVARPTLPPSRLRGPQPELVERPASEGKLRLHRTALRGQRYPTAIATIEA